MALEYKILMGETSPSRMKSEETLFHEKLKDLEKQVNSVLAIGGSTVGGIHTKGNYPYQPVMVPNASTNVEPTNPISYTRAVRRSTPGAGGPSRKSKSRKSRKSRKL
jgi:hypothetical protein